jgi:hypothetical protein
MGDSHAMMWLPAIVATAHREHFKVLPIVKLGCSVAALSEDRFGRACSTWARWAVRKAAAEHPSVTLVTSFWSYLGNDTGELLASLSTIAKDVRPSKLVAIGDPPGVVPQPVDCLLGSNVTLDRCTTNWSSQRFMADQLVAAGAGPYRYIDTRGWFCSGSACPMVVGNTVVYTDENHLTAEYSAALARVFQEALDRAVGAKH